MQLRANVVNMMRKMSGGELGKLLLKDVIAGLGGGSRAYTIEDFDAVVHRLDWRNRREYLKYTEMVDHISTRLMYGWWLCSVIEKFTLRFDCILCITRLFHTYRMASLGLTCQRLSYAISDDEWRDPGEEEILLRDLSQKLEETSLEDREGVAELHNTLMDFVKQYLTFDQIMKSLAEMVEIPELASIVESPVHYVEQLSQSIKSELEILPPDSPYRELLPEIDISGLEPDMAEVESYISDNAEFLKA